MIEYDEDRMKRVAAIIVRLNPHAAGYTVDDMVASMKRVAEQSFTRESLGYVSTRGYVLSACITDEGVLYVYPSVSDYIITP